MNLKTFKAYKLESLEEDFRTWYEANVFPEILHTHFTAGEEYILLIFYK